MTAYHPTDAELVHLRRCIELAREAFNDGDAPFGSVLVDREGNPLAEDRNRETSQQDETQHPEFALARWAAQHLTASERAAATVFTSGEHCPMCSAAHGWVGLGRIVYIHSSTQFAAWQRELGGAESLVRPIPAQEVAPHVVVEGPVEGLDEQMRELHRQACDARA